MKKDQIPLEARILHVVLLHDELLQKGWSDAQIFDSLKKSPGRVDPALLDALKKAGTSSARKRWCACCRAR